MERASFSPTPLGNGRPRLLDQVRNAIRALHYSLRTEQTYVHWIKRFILFHGKRHPAEMGKVEVMTFLTYLAVQRDVAASTQNQALSAILFLYREVLELELEWVEGFERPTRPVRLPVVLTVVEARAVLGQLEGTKWLMGSLLYGSGLRLMECLRLRVKDIDFGYGQILVQDGKGAKDRVTMLPATRPYASLRAATPSAIPSPPTCWNRATTSAPCRSCSGTPTDLHACAQQGRARRAKPAGPDLTRPAIPRRRARRGPVRPAPSG